MRRIRLTVAYDGTNYVGWQVQPNGVSIEEILNRELSRMLKECLVNSFFPSSSSNAFSCLERVGCVTCRISAALVMFSSRATARKYLKVFISM